MVKKILTLLLWCLFAVGVAALLLWATLAWKLPWWVGPSCLAGLLGLWLAFRLTRRLVARYRHKDLVSHVVASTPLPLAELPDEQNREQSLRNQWAKALAALKSSTLRVVGNPLKAMPWYVMLGESRDGKTTAIKHSRTSSPLTDVDGAAQEHGTRHCDWWFCDQAVILDTAGRYAIPLSETEDRKEWEVFLELLFKTRKRKALQGVIVAIAADRLLAEQGQSLVHKGQMIRQKLNQLMRLTGSRLPVYLLVTKMDLVHGFSDFFQSLSDGQAEDTMGIVNGAPDRPFLESLQQAFADLGERLHQLRKILLHTVQLGHFPGAIVFPSEFQALREPLSEFGQGLFGFDRYLEPPFLRGIYFSSSQRKGQPASPFLSLISGHIPAAVTADSPQGQP